MFWQAQGSLKRQDDAKMLVTNPSGVSCVTSIAVVYRYIVRNSLLVFNGTSPFRAVLTGVRRTRKPVMAYLAYVWLDQPHTDWIVAVQPDIATHTRLKLGDGTTITLGAAYRLAGRQAAYAGNPLWYCQYSGSYAQFAQRQLQNEGGDLILSEHDRQWWDAEDGLNAFTTAAGKYTSAQPCWQGRQLTKRVIRDVQERRFVRTLRLYACASLGINSTTNLPLPSRGFLTEEQAMLLNWFLSSGRIYAVGSVVADLLTYCFDGERFRSSTHPLFYLPVTNRPLPFMGFITNLCERGPDYDIACQMVGEKRVMQDFELAQRESCEWGWNGTTWLICPRSL